MTADDEMPSSRRQLIWIGGGLAALIVLTSVLLTVRSPASLEPGSPEAVVQQYLMAVLDGDERSAVALMATESGCDTGDFTTRADTRDVRISLIESDQSGDEADVVVRIRYNEAGIALSSYDFDERFALVRESGEWRLTGQPWPLFFCEGDA